MHKKTSFTLISLFLILTFLLAGAVNAATLNQTGSIADVTVQRDSVEWQINLENSGAILTVALPDGTIYQQAFVAGDTPAFSAGDVGGSALGDGLYQYELEAIPVVDDEVKAILASAASSLDRAALIQQLQAEGRIPTDNTIQSGSFMVQSGQISLENPDLAENSNSINDVVTPDDSIIQGSQCVGFDCVNNEDFGFDTLRLKENNTRITFDDTSSSTGFPANDWTIVANDSASGGSNYLAFQDVTGSTFPFRVDAGAPDNALRVTSTGDVGLGTSLPQVKLHIVDGDTPTLRLDQDSSLGNALQAWDVGGNENSFFVSDSTNSAAVPFQIQAGAPSDSLVVKSNGYLGVGTGDPQAQLQVTGNAIINGNLQLDGYISELSDVNAKFNFASVNNASVLEKLASIPISTWNYKQDSSQSLHMGPMAQDFYAAFGLGADNRHLSALDVNGVALAAIQELNSQVQQRDAQISGLKDQVSNLEARVNSLEQKTDSKQASASPWISLLVGLAGVAVGYAATRRKAKAA